MARRSSFEPLHVYLNSRLVGQLRRERSGAIEFQYDAEWFSDAPRAASIEGTFDRRILLNFRP